MGWCHFWTFDSLLLLSPSSNDLPTKGLLELTETKESQLDF
jgi:hypothetical protein